MIQTTELHRMPDIQSSQTESRLEIGLEWVGMSRIEVPVQVVLAGGERLTLKADVDSGVNLVNAKARGIHMSRLYRTVMDELPKKPLHFSLLEEIIQNFLETHVGLSTEAEIKVQFQALILRPSLKSGLLGYRSYPVEMKSVSKKGRLQRFLKAQVIYSSTCPQSAALARDLVAQDFLGHFSEPSVDKNSVVDWLRSPEGMAATPHAQRSQADIQVELSSQGPDFNFEDLIDLLERALLTPVQSVVKRVDEQEFARLNGTHLMFCEDAARRIKAALVEAQGVVGFDGVLRHQESLHPHDAVARICS